MNTIVLNCVLQFFKSFTHFYEKSKIKNIKKYKKIIPLVNKIKDNIKILEALFD